MDAGADHVPRCVTRSVRDCAVLPSARGAGWRPWRRLDGRRHLRRGGRTARLRLGDSACQCATAHRPVLLGLGHRAARARGGSPVKAWPRCRRWGASDRTPSRSSPCRCSASIRNAVAGGAGVGGAAQCARYVVCISPEAPARLKAVATQTREFAINAIGKIRCSLGFGVLE